MKKILTLTAIILLFSCQKEIQYRLMGVGMTIKDTTINYPNVWDGGGKVIDLNNWRIHGNGGFQNWDISASLNQQIFDTSISLKNIKSANGIFSTAWYGVKSSNADNWWNLQKSINVCKAERLKCYTPGKGTYYFSKPLEFYTKNKGIYQQFYIDFSGDASYWDNGSGTTFQYTGTQSPAFDVQLNKGSVFENFVVKGLWQSPGGSDSAYFNLSEANYKDVSAYNLPDYYTGFAIDNNYDGRSISGSTGITIKNVSIGGFGMLLAFSQNGMTRNNDAHTIDNIHFYDGKYAIVNGQAQEKGTSINHIYSWGSIYNIINIGLHGAHQAGNYSFNVANIAGRCIEPINVSIAHWYSSSINNWYCESIGRVGTFSAQMPFTISNSNFNLNYHIPKDRVVINSNSLYTSFENCTIRYYDGAINNIYVHGYMTWSGTNYFGGGKLIYK